MTTPADLLLTTAEVHTPEPLVSTIVTEPF